MSTALNIGSAGRSPKKRDTFAEAKLRSARARQSAKKNIQWPNAKYAKDPVGFFRDILGIEVWDRQQEVLEAVRDHDSVAIRAAQKLSKTHSSMGLALWFYCSFDNAKVRITSASNEQVEKVLFQQLLELKDNAGLCVACRKADPHQPKPCAHSALIDGKVGKLARTGIKSKRGYRIISGFSVKKTENLGGFSGKNQFWILDEASGIEPGVFEAAEGNLVAGGKLLLISNPTRTYGYFYDVFHSKSYGWHLIHLSAFDSPNVKLGVEVVPGLASLASIEKLAMRYGVESALYVIRVEGNFANQDEGRIFSPEMIKWSKGRWDTAVETDYVLSIGLDPSGSSGMGDDFGWAAVRGNKMLRCDGVLGLDDDAAIAMLDEWLTALTLPGEMPLVTIDREGAEGARIYGAMKGWAENGAGKGRCWVRGVRSSENAIRQPLSYKAIRDELCAALFAWMKDGGALLDDAKLEQDLLAQEWLTDIKGRNILAPKKAVRKVLGRSPDRYDALTNAVWNSVPVKKAPRASAPSSPPRTSIDPYAARGTWKR